MRPLSRVLPTPRRGREEHHSAPPSVKKSPTHSQNGEQGWAHSTLDDYELGGNDIGDVVLGSLTIACAIEAAVGDVAISNYLARVETSGFEAAAMLLHPGRQRTASDQHDSWVLADLGQQQDRVPLITLRTLRLRSQKKRMGRSMG